MSLNLRSTASRPASSDETAADAPALAPGQTPAPIPAKSVARRRLVITLLERVALPLIVGGTVLLAWWGVRRLNETQAQSAALSQQISRLSTETELMQSQWPAQRVESVTQRFDQATNAVFQGSAAVAHWRDAMFTTAVPLALDLDVRFDGTRLHDNGENAPTVMRAIIEVTPAEAIDSPRSAYQRILDFTQNLTTQTQRLDLLELHVRGTSNSVSYAQAVVELWGTEPAR